MRGGGGEGGGEGGGGERRRWRGRGSRRRRPFTLRDLLRWRRRPRTDEVKAEALIRGGEGGGGDAAAEGDGSARVAVRLRRPGRCCPRGWQASGAQGRGGECWRPRHRRRGGDVLHKPAMQRGSGVGSRWRRGRRSPKAVAVRAAEVRAVDRAVGQDGSRGRGSWSASPRRWQRTEASAARGRDGNVVARAAGAAAREGGGREGGGSGRRGTWWNQVVGGKGGGEGARRRGRCLPILPR